MVDARTSMTNWPGMDHLDPRSYLRVLIDGKPIVAMVDTGATHSLILLHKAASLGVTAEMLAADPTGQSRGVGPATVRTPVHRFAKVQIGGLEFSNVTMPVVDANNPEAATYLETGMFLGMDYLARHRVWLAHASRLVLVPSVAQ
jgi:predicted aspartyl protease